jgi:hypothetical protein
MECNFTLVQMEFPQQAVIRWLVRDNLDMDVTIGTYKLSNAVREDLSVKPIPPRYFFQMTATFPKLNTANMFKSLNLHADLASVPYPLMNLPQQQLNSQITDCDPIWLYTSTNNATFYVTLPLVNVNIFTWTFEATQDILAVIMQISLLQR